MVFAGLLLYNLLAALEPSIVALLHDIGAQNLIDGRNPVSFCNVLFISQLVSLASFLLLFPSDLTRANFAKLTRRKALALLAYVAVGSVLVQLFYFYALAHADIADIVLVSSLQIPLAALLNIFLFRELLVRRQMGGHALLLIGIAMPLSLSLLAGMSGTDTTGLALAFAAMLCGTACGLLAKYLSDLPLGVIGVTASALAALFFFVFASLYFGVEHFRDLLTPYVWQLVFVYAIAIVVCRHIIRQMSFRRASNQAINTISASYPALAVLCGFAVAGQIPSATQLLGIACIIPGIVLALNAGTRRFSFIEKQNRVSGGGVRVNA